MTDTINKQIRYKCVLCTISSSISAVDQQFLILGTGTVSSPGPGRSAVTVKQVKSNPINCNL